MIEEALEESRLTYFDGFTGSKSPFFNVSAIERDKLPPHWTRLWKLHGSINWNESEGSGSVCRVTTVTEQKSLIHPSHRKYDQSRRLPYLALIDRLKVFMRRHSCVLVVSGYSFADAHLNEVIMDGLESNPTALVLALAYGRLDNYDLLRRYAETNANLTVFAEDCGVVGKRTGAWLVVGNQDLSALKFAFAQKEIQTEIHSEADTDQALESNDPATILSGNYLSRLGDFAALGEFLIDVSGSFSQVERAARA